MSRITLVKSLERTTRKWVDRAGVAAGDYVDGVNDSKRDWDVGAKAGEARWKTETAKAIAEGRFGKGITGEAKSKYLRKATGIGATNYAPGVAAAEADFADAMGPVLAHEDALQRRILAMPNATREQREARAIAWMRGMAELTA